MKSRLLLIVLLSIPAVTLASLPKTPSTEERLKSLVAKRLSGPDVRVEVERSDDGFCGKDGPTWFAHVNVRRPHKFLNEDTGETELRNEHFEHVATYYVAAKDLNRRDATVRPVAACDVPPERTIDLRGGN